MPNLRKETELRKDCYCGCLLKELKQKRNTEKIQKESEDLTNKENNSFYVKIQNKRCALTKLGQLPGKPGFLEPS